MRSDILEHAGEQDEAWLEDRVGFFTGSEAYKLMMKGRGGAPSLTRKRYVEKIAFERETGIRVKENVDSYYVDFGSSAEKFIREFFEFVTRMNVVCVGFVKSKDVEYFGVSPDGVIPTDNAVLEIKTTGPDYMELLLDGGPIKKAHYIQMQSAMMVTEAEKAHYFVMERTAPVFLHRIVRACEETQEEIRKQVRLANEEIEQVFV